MEKSKEKHFRRQSSSIKRPEMFLPDYCPTYFNKAKGINVWDLNNKKYIDMIFAVGQSTLGYANSEIDQEVKKAINNGNMSTKHFRGSKISSKPSEITPLTGMTNLQDLAVKQTL